MTFALQLVVALVGTLCMRTIIVQNDTMEGELHQGEGCEGIPLSCILGV